MVGARSRSLGCYVDSAVIVGAVAGLEEESSGVKAGRRCGGRCWRIVAEEVVEGDSCFGRQLGLGMVEEGRIAA